MRMVGDLLASGGYRVVNLGIKQPITNILNAAKEHKADAIGKRSALSVGFDSVFDMEERVSAPAGGPVTGALAAAVEAVGAWRQMLGDAATLDEQAARHAHVPPVQKPEIATRPADLSASAQAVTSAKLTTSRRASSGVVIRA